MLTSKGERAPGHLKINLRFMLAQPRMHEFEQLALNIATPGHSLYGQHLSKEEIDDFSRPTDKTTSKVTTWLLAAGISSDDILNQGRLMGLTTNISQAEVLLQTKFHEYGNKNKTIVRALQYSLPASLHEQILFVQPTTRFVQTRPMYHSVRNSVPVSPPPDPEAGDDNKCNQIVTPICLRGQYHILSDTGGHLDNNKIGVSGYLDQYASKSDLTKFINMFSHYFTDLNFTYHSISGGQDLQNSPLNSEEANLDVCHQSSIGMA